MGNGTSACKTPMAQTYHASRLVLGVVGSANARHHVGGWSYLLFFALLFLATFLACPIHNHQVDIVRPMQLTPPCRWLRHAIW